MTRRAVDLEKVRLALRRMSRGNLLIVAERAAELVPRAKLRALVGDLVRLEDLAEGRSGAPPCSTRCGSYTRPACAYWGTLPLLSL